LSCDQIQSRLDDWLDDSLSSDERRGIEVHLDRCDHCRRIFDAHRGLTVDLIALGHAADSIGGFAKTPVITRKVTPIWRVAAMLLLAASAIVATKIFLQAERHTIVVVDSNPPETSSRPIDRTPAADEREGFNIDVSDSYLAVQMKSSDPTIHIVWLYGEPDEPEIPGPSAIEAELKEKGETP